MHTVLSDEQALLAESAAGILARHDTVARAREALDGVPVPSLWESAIQAGWPGLLVGEDADGADLGASEAMLVAQACGAALADVGLLGHLPATVLLENASADPDLRAAVAAGEQRAAFVDASSHEVRSRGSNGSLVLDGAASAVLDAPSADLLVVTAPSERGVPVVALVDGSDPALSVEPTPCYDATRSIARVVFDGARATSLGIRPDRVQDGRDLQRALLAGEAVGAGEACLTMARAYAIERHAFGRPIGSFQAIKHKLVEMLRRIEAGRSLLIYAGRAWEHARHEFPIAANAARVVATDALDYAAPENIFIHGGIGATWEHDAQLYYRRAEVSRRLAGGVDAAADTVAAELLDRRRNGDA
jgi:alkylation response protein AidB-like acyl-CoA dehydrogenase